MESFFEPFKYEFFRNGVAVATISGALCGLIGVFVILRGMSYIGHGLSHSIFGGFAISTLVGVAVEGVETLARWIVGNDRQRSTFMQKLPQSVAVVGGIGRTLSRRIGTASSASTSRGKHI